MTTKTDAVVDEVASLAAQGQGVESLTYPVGAKRFATPGILTAVVPKVGEPRGLVVRYFLEGKLSPLARTLALLDVVDADTAVQGIESQIVMIDMQPPAERAADVATAQARLTELDGLVLMLSVDGMAAYAERVSAERDALCRLLDAAGQPYTPEPVLSEVDAQAAAEQTVDGLLGMVRHIEVFHEPAMDEGLARAQAEAQAAADVERVLAAARKGTK